MKKEKDGTVKVIPLGGLEQIGMNMTAFMYGDSIIVVDCGLSFPDDDMLGIDLVIPDVTFLKDNIDKVKGFVVTHGHEDHIGAFPYVLKDVNKPIYATKLTMGIIETKLKEHNLIGKTKLVRVKAGGSVTVSKNFTVEFIRTNHSIADSCALAIKTPIGNILHMGDFKIDTTPIVGDMIDLARIGELGSEGLLELMSDSTNVERPGYAMSERTVGRKFEDIFANNADKRIIIATFASNIHRVQQIIDAAVKNKRKVAVSGRSMENIVELSILLGYMKVPEGVLINIDNINKYKPNQIVIITTGSQGEPMSALTRMAYSDHRKVEVTKDDLIIISATPIPGNEKSVSNVINELFKIGAKVIYKSLMDIHVSGHACQEELKMILALAKPKFFIPVHGECRHLILHGKLAETVGMDKSNVFILNNGTVLEMDEKSARTTGIVPAGKILVDGLGVGDVGNIVLRDRKLLSQDGLIIVVITINDETNEIVSGPDVISRGFVYVRESEGLIDNIRSVAAESINQCLNKNNSDWTVLKNNMRNSVARYIYDTTKRSPMILPIIEEI